MYVTETCTWSKRNDSVLSIISCLVHNDQPIRWRCGLTVRTVASPQPNEIPLNWKLTLPKVVNHIDLILEIMLQNSTAWRNYVSLSLCLALTLRLCVWDSKWMFTSTLSSLSTNPGGNERILTSPTTSLEAVNFIWLANSYRVQRLKYATYQTAWKSLQQKKLRYVSMAADWRSKTKAVNNRNVVSLR